MIDHRSKPYRSTRYQLGDVKPWVAYAADVLGSRYGIGTILGWGRRSNSTDHDDGLALDFMTRNGDALAADARANARALGVTYVIWNQRIWSAARNSEGWRPMADRGSATANHRDHVHVSFTASPPRGFAGVGAPQAEGHVTPSNPAVATTVSAGERQESLAATAQTAVLYGGALCTGALLIVLGIYKSSGVALDIPLVKGKVT